MRCGSRMAKLATALTLLVLASTSADAQYTNVALGKAVTGFGTFGGDASRDGINWPNPAPADFSTLTDGVVVPNGTQWQTGTVWWDRGFIPDPEESPFQPPTTYLTIDLGASYAITGFGISADNNDVYAWYTRESELDEWVARIASNAPLAGGGMNYFRYDDFFSGAPFQARYVALSAWRGDGWYSVSELEVYSASVPEPTGLLLLSAGLLALVASARRRCAE